MTSSRLLLGIIWLVICVLASSAFVPSYITEKKKYASPAKTPFQSPRKVDVANSRRWSHMLDDATRGVLNEYFSAVGASRKKKKAFEAELLGAAADFTTSSSSLLGSKSLGIDLGEVRTGVGVTMGYTFQPLATITKPSNQNLTWVANEIIKRCRAEAPSRVVVGYPLHKNGTEAEMSILANSFAVNLTALILDQLGPKIDVFLWDERYSSKYAIARIKGIDPDQNTYKSIDGEAACIILEDFYRANGCNAIQVVLAEETRLKCLQQWKLRSKEKQREMRLKKEQVEAKLLERKQARHRQCLERAELRTQGLLPKKKRKKKKRR